MMHYDPEVDELSKAAAFTCIDQLNRHPFSLSLLSYFDDKNQIVPGNLAPRNVLIGDIFTASIFNPV
jgi:hypothetical protein